MAKLTTYLVIMGGMMMIFYFGGILESSLTIQLLTNMQDIAQSPLWIAIIAIFVTLAAAGVVTGFVTRDSRVLELIVYIPIVYLLFEYAWDIIKIYSKMVSLGGGSSILASIIFSPLIIVYVLTLLEWYRGMTT